ncbi:MAG TPA: ABC transporter substrate-binding protein [Spirochaetia bacterium]|nr:ABC transporter substrate-binding protein [Spirochaetia bacterium]
MKIRNGIVAVTLAAFILLPALVWASGKSEQGAAPSSQSLPRNQTLYIGGFQWGAPTNFNPLSSNPAWPVGGNGGTGLQADGYIYETLFTFNIVNGKSSPLLGKSMEWTNPSTLVIKLQPGTMWQDGQPLTAKDVVFTFELAKKISLGYSPFWDYVSAIKALDDQTVEVDLSKPNQGQVVQYIDTCYILPEHIWSSIAAGGQAAVLQETNFAPVGSGPYKIKSYSPEQVVLEQAASYWGSSLYGMPTPKYIVHPVFKSNDDGNLALKQGNLDWSQQFVPNVWTIKNVGTWYSDKPYYVPGSIPMMWFNMTKPGLNNALVRRAIAYSINYPLIAQTAMSEYSEPAKSSLIIPTGVESQYFDASNVAQNGWSYDPAKATDILVNQLHATKGSDGIYVLPDGTKLSFTVETPYGWTDWMAALQVVSQSAKAVGIDIHTQFPQAPIVTSDVQSGKFDLALWYASGVGPAAPWARFRDVMDSRGVPPVGQTAFWDYERYSNPEATTLLDEAAAATSPAALKDALGKLDTLYMKDIPVVPLMYRPLLFYEFNTSVWTGFPTDQNPQGSQPLFDISVLRHLTAK